MKKNLCKNGIVIASNDYQPGWTERTKECAFDGNLDTCWAGLGCPTTDRAWIGYEFKTPMRISKILLQQMSSNSSISKVMVQGINNEEWEDIKEFNLKSGDNILDLSDDISYFKKYRLLAKSEPRIATWAWAVNNIEMYGFPYKFLLKQNNNYYTLKSEHYQNGQFQPLILEGGTEPNETDYETFGFEDINDLLIPQNTKTIQGIDMGVLGEGKYFELGLDSEIKKIINIEYESDNIPNKNLALNRPITSSKEPYGVYTPDKAVDGNLSSDMGFLKSDYGKVSLTIELDDIYLVNKIQLKQLNYGGYRCKNFTVEVSTNDIDYIEVYAGTLVNNNNIQEFIFNKCYKCKYFKFNIKDNYIASNKSNGIGEIEIYGVNYKFLLKHSNQFYTFSNSDIVLSPSQELTEANFKINGFDDVTNIEEEQWNDAFPDKIDLRLLIWTEDLDKTKIKAECGVKPYIPYDKLNNEFDICMATEKNVGIS